MTTTAIDEKVRAYLLGTLGEAERDAFEESLLTDEELYYEVVETENDLIDRYTAGELNSKEAECFERSLKSSATRRERVENAKALRAYIAEERGSLAAITSAEAGPGFFARLSSLFSSQFSAPAYAMAGMIIVLAAGMALLYSANRQNAAEVSRLQGELQSRQKGSPELDRKLEESQNRIDELQSAIDEERDASGDLTADLARERDHRRKLEREIASLKNSESPGQVATRPPGNEAVTVLTLDGNTPLASPDFPPDAERVSIIISLPATVEENERVSIRLNGKEISNNVAVRSSGGGGRSVNVSVPAGQLIAGENILTVNDRSGAEIARHRVRRAE